MDWQRLTVLIVERRLWLTVITPASLPGPRNSYLRFAVSHC